MGKVRGGDLSVRQDGGIPLSDPSLRSQRGARSPPALWNPRPLRAFPPPSLVSIEVCGRSIAGVSSERSLSPAREAAFRVGPLGDASSARGGAGGPEGRWRRRPTAGVGRGRSRHPPRSGRIAGSLLGQRDVGVSGSHLAIATIAVAVRLPRRGSADPCSVSYLVNGTYGVA